MRVHAGDTEGFTLCGKLRAKPRKRPLVIDRGAVTCRLCLRTIEAMRRREVRQVLRDLPRGKR